MKKGKFIKTHIKFCPRCKSLNIKMNYKGGLVFLGVPPSFTCQNCGYTSNIFPELMEKAKKWKERSKKKNKKKSKQKK